MIEEANNTMQIFTASAKELFRRENHLQIHSGRRMITIDDEDDKRRKIITKNENNKKK